MAEDSLSELAPILDGEAAAAVAHRDSHVQIIAAAGSGKTEVVAQRVASLLEDGEPADSIVAFTFTEKAAAELKDRIKSRVMTRLGAEGGNQLSRLYVGTIHSYCFRLLQLHVPKFETYTPLDPNQLTNLLYRESNRLKLKRLDRDGKLFRAMRAFQDSIDVLENELLRLEDLPQSDFRESAADYYATLDSYRFMSFGTQIVEAVRALEDPQIHERVTADLRHLIVDEYQDVNPAQERLIELLSRPVGPADLVVVGDDDQAIYQWRGSNVSNIVRFVERYGEVATFNLLVNRRSRPGIVKLANEFANSIAGRLIKDMKPYREEDGPAVSIAIGHEDEQTEADAIALDIEALHSRGVRYRDMAILVRGRNAYAKILDALEVYRIPVQPGGRTGLFEQPEAALFGATFAWLAGIDWAKGRFIKREVVALDDLLGDYQSLFALSDVALERVRERLENWYTRIRNGEPDWNPSLVGEFYSLAALVGVASWDLSDPVYQNRLGTLGRFTQVLADYESVNRRSRRDPNNPAEQVGGVPGDEWFYRNFALLLVNYATSNYDDFDGGVDLQGDSVALGTIHGAKGLEWPVVFLPSLTDGRFPSARSGQSRDWLLPTTLFDSVRYEGSDEDERRLFYVGLTRARDWVALSSHSKVTTNSARPSPYLLEVAQYATNSGLPTGVAARGSELPDVMLSYSELDTYMKCPRSYLLRVEMGFMPEVRAEIGYGNAIHHAMRAIADYVKSAGQLPRPKVINDLFNSDFFLPFANKAQHIEMRDKARQLAFTYVKDHKDDLLRTWETERPFELYLDGIVVSGRADVIYDEHGGIIGNLEIVDYKTAIGGEAEPLQLQVYSDAARKEGLTVAAALIEDMSTATRHTVDISEEALRAAESAIVEAAGGLRQRDFAAKPSRQLCRYCDVHSICGAAILS